MDRHIRASHGWTASGGVIAPPAGAAAAAAHRQPSAEKSEPRAGAAAAALPPLPQTPLPQTPLIPQLARGRQQLWRPLCPLRPLQHLLRHLLPCAAAQQTAMMRCWLPLPRPGRLGQNLPRTAAASCASCSPASCSARCGTACCPKRLRLPLPWQLHWARHQPSSAWGHPPGRPCCWMHGLPPPLLGTATSRPALPGGSPISSAEPELAGW